LLPCPNYESENVISVAEIKIIFRNTGLCGSADQLAPLVRRGVVNITHGARHTCYLTHCGRAVQMRINGDKFVIVVLVRIGVGWQLFGRVPPAAAPVSSMPDALQSESARVYIGCQLALTLLPIFTVNGFDCRAQ